MRARRLLAALAVGAAILSPLGGLRAAGSVFSNDVDVTLSGSGITVTILSGANVDSVNVGTSTLTVVASSGDSLTLRYPAPSPGTLANDGSLASCNLVSGNNQATVTGPATVVFTPNTTPCAASSGGGAAAAAAASLIPPTVAGVTPSGGERWTAGVGQRIAWSTSGNAPHAVTLKLSTDGGLTYPYTIADSISDVGSYMWSPPAAYATSKARVRTQAMVGGLPVSTASSAADFSILDSDAAKIVLKDTKPVPPSGGPLKPGDKPPVKWTVTGTGAARARISLSVNEGETWRVVAEVADAAAGNYDWVVPKFATKKARIKVELLDAAGAVISETITETFSFSNRRPASPLALPKPKS